MRNSTDGERVCNYYHLQEFPSIFIVDPRTGERVHKILLPNKMDPLSLSDQCECLALSRLNWMHSILISVTTFLDKTPTLHAFDQLVRGPTSLIDATTNSNSNSPVPALLADEVCSFSTSVILIDAFQPISSASNGLSNAVEKQPRKRKADANGEVEVKRGRSDNEPDEGMNGRGMIREWFWQEWIVADDVDEILNHDTSIMSVIDQEEWLNECAPTGSLVKLRLKFPDSRDTTIEMSENSKLKASQLLAGIRDEWSFRFVSKIWVKMRKFNFKNW